MTAFDLLAPLASAVIGLSIGFPVGWEAGRRSWRGGLCLFRRRAMLGYIGDADAAAARASRRLARFDTFALEGRP